MRLNRNELTFRQDKRANVPGRFVFAVQELGAHCG